MLPLVLVYAVFVVFWAYVNSVAIHYDVYIHHWANFFLHAVACLAGASTEPLTGLAMVFEGRLLFDVSLNLFRFGWNGIGYVPANPKSLFDRAEIYFFKNDGLTPKALYAVVFFSLLFL